MNNKEDFNGYKEKQRFYENKCKVTNVIYGGKKTCETIKTLEEVSKEKLVRLAKENNIRVLKNMTKATIIEMLKGRGVTNE